MKLHTVKHVTKKRIRTIASNTWVKRFIRLGYAIRGLLYILIGLFALELSIGLNSQGLSQNEIIVKLSTIPFGQVLLLLVICGLGGYSLWGFIRAILDYIDSTTDRIPFFQRIGYLFSGIFYASLISPALSLLENKNNSQTKIYSLKSFSEMILTIPFGRVILLIIGSIICFTGIFQIYKAIRSHTPEDLNYVEKKVFAPTLFMVISRIGISMRGLLWIIIGIFALIASNPSDIKSTNEALTTIITLPFGHIVGGTIGIGFVLFGIYSLTSSFWAALPDYENNTPAKQLKKVTLEKLEEKAQEHIVSPKVRWYRSTVVRGYIILSVAAFVILANLAHVFPYFPIDLAITRSIQRFNPSWFDNLMRFISYIGFIPQVDVLVGIIVILLFLFGLRWEALVAFLNSVSVTGVNIVIKDLVNRPRPDIDLVRISKRLNETSFPSGHVMFYTAFFGFLWYLTFTILSKSWHRTLLLIIFSVLIILIAPSRIYLGAHWASDVFGAYLFGSLYLLLTIEFYHWGKKRFFVRQPTAPEKV